MGCSSKMRIDHLARGKRDPTLRDPAGRILEACQVHVTFSRVKAAAHGTLRSRCRRCGLGGAALGLQLPNDSLAGVAPDRAPLERIGADACELVPSDLAHFGLRQLDARSTSSCTYSALRRSTASRIWRARRRPAGIRSGTPNSRRRTIWMRSATSRCTILLFARVNTDQCALRSPADANFLRYGYVLVEDCCATTSPAFCVQAPL